jgi:hypothetical protein
MFGAPGGANELPAELKALITASGERLLKRR